MRVLLLLGIILVSQTGQGSALESSREVFPQIVQNEQKMAKLIADLEKDKSAIAKAYRGAMIIMSAEYTSYPLRKYNRFKKGKALIESAIAADPQNPEIRYIRILVQSKCPDMLGYNNDIVKDMNVLLAHKGKLKAEGLMLNRIRTNLKKINNLPEEAAIKLEQL